MGALSYTNFAILTLVVMASALATKKHYVPVLIWGNSYDLLKPEDRIPPFKEVSSDEFFNHFLKNVHKEGKKPPVVLFVEETFSTEDFSSQIDKYDTAFQSLEDISSKNNLEYLLSVEDPVNALSESNIKSYGLSYIELSDSDYDNIHLKNSVVYMVNLEDADSKEDRPEMLQRHDEKIASIYNKLAKNNKDFVAILTGRYSSWTEPDEVIRVRRQANNETARNESGPTKPSQPAKASFGIILETKTALIYTKKPLVLKIDDKEINLQAPTNWLSDDREKLQRAIFSYVTELGKVNLRFRFENTSNNYWSLSQVELEGPVKDLVLLSTKRHIGAPYDHSFHTSTPVVFSNGSISLTFSDIQVQPWKSPSELNKKFGIAEDDTSFFTPAIWTGLIVTGLLGLILVWALSMIMDIRTMDQFDDPKGKTITVNVTD